MVLGSGVAGLGAYAHAAPTPTPVAGCNTRAAVPASYTTNVHGVARTYRVHLPAGYNGRKAFPLILAYPGHAEPSARFERYTGLSALPAIVVYPDGLLGTDGTVAWQGAPYSSPQADDIAFTSTILREVRANLCVNRARTYAVGHSNGGGLVSMLACRLPGDFAAYAIVNGALYAQSQAACTTSRAPASIIDFHGTADPTIRYNGGEHLGGSYPPIFAAAQSWARRNGCVPTPLTIPITNSVTQFVWPLCNALGSEVSHYRITGGKHRWPVGNIAATRLIWQFFNRHPLSI